MWQHSLAFVAATAPLISAYQSTTRMLNANTTSTATDSITNIPNYPVPIPSAGLPRENKKYWHEYYKNISSGLPVDSDADKWVKWLLMPLPDHNSLHDEVIFQDSDPDPDDGDPTTCKHKLQKLQEQIESARESAELAEKEAVKSAAHKLQSFRINGQNHDSWDDYVKAVLDGKASYQYEYATKYINWLFSKPGYFDQLNDSSTTYESRLMEVRQLQLITAGHADAKENAAKRAIAQQLAKFEVTANKGYWNKYIQDVINKAAQGGGLNLDVEENEAYLYTNWLFTDSGSELPFLNETDPGGHLWKGSQADQLQQLAAEAEKAKKVMKDELEARQRNKWINAAKRLEEDQLYLLRHYMQCCTSFNGRITNPMAITSAAHVQFFMATPLRSNEGIGSDGPANEADAELACPKEYEELLKAHSSVLKRLSDAGEYEEKSLDELLEPGREDDGQLKEEQKRYDHTIKIAQDAANYVYLPLDKLLKPGKKDPSYLGMFQAKFSKHVKTAQHIDEWIKTELPKLPEGSSQDLERKTRAIKDRTTVKQAIERCCQWSPGELTDTSFSVSMLPPFKPRQR